MPWGFRFRQPKKQIYQVSCEGLTDQEFASLRDALRAQFPGVEEFHQQVYRVTGPSIPDFLLFSAPAAYYVGRKVVDLIVDIIEDKLKNAKGRKTLTIFGPNGKVLTEVKKD